MRVSATDTRQDTRQVTGTPFVSAQSSEEKSVQPHNATLPKR